MVFSSGRYHLTVAAFAWFAAVGCSSTDEQSGEEGLVVEAEAGDNVNNDTSDEFAGNADEDYAGATGEEGAGEKVPIAEDGFDDDWNNMGTAQQQQLKQNTNKNLAANLQNQNSNQYDLDDYEQAQGAQYAPNYAAQSQVQYEPPLDQAVPQYQPAPVANYTEPQPTPAPPVAAILPEAGTPLIMGEVLPQLAEVWWVGYDFTEDDRFVRIEIVTQGTPKFNVFQERNQNDQPELVLRFFDSTLRSKMRRDIDASEFRSPVAYVRMRTDLEQQHVDVILTMRDAVQPRLYAEAGNVLMTFAVPDYYLGNATIGDTPIARAEILPNATVMPQIDPGSELPEGLKVAQAYVPNPSAQAFSAIPETGGTEVDTGLLPVAEVEPVSDDGLPANFDNYGSNANAGYDAYGTQNAIGNTYGSQANYGADENYGENAYGAEGNDVTIDTGAGEGYDYGQGEYEYQQSQYGQQEQYQGQSQQYYDGEEGDYEEGLDNDSLDDYEYDDEGGASDIDKFEVRMTTFRYLSIAQDNYGAGEYGEDYGAAPAGDNYGAYEEDAAGDDYGSFDEPTSGNSYGTIDAGNGMPANATLNGGGTGNFEATAGGDEYGSDGMFDDAGGDGYEAAGASGGGDYAAPINVAPINAAPVNAGAAAYSTATPVNYGEGAYATASPSDYGNEIVGTAEAVPQADPDNSRRIELDFENAPLAAVIKTLSEESGVNFILSNSATASTVSIKMSGISFNDALKAILDANGLGLVEIGPNLIRIDSLAAIAEAEQRKLAASQAESLRRPTQILVHRLSYARAEDVLETTRALVTGISPGDARVSVQLDNRTNSVIVNAPPSVHGTVKALLERVDLETPQVKIASRIIEVNSGNGSSFGISWGGPVDYDQAHGLGFGSLPFPNFMQAGYSVDAGGQGANQAGNLKFHFGSIGDVTSLDLFLSMNEARSNIEILQTSDVIVEDNTEAQISAGGTEYFQPPPSSSVIMGGGAAAGGAAAGGGGEGGSGLNEIEYNLTLTVTPRVTADGRVQMALDISSATPVPPERSAAASANTRNLRTSLLRRSGETAVIGGIYNTNRSKVVSGIPGLSSLPLIGALFRSTIEDESKKELMILVTPTILGIGGGGSLATPAAASSAIGDYNSNYSGNTYGGEYNDSTINGGADYNSGANYNYDTQADYGGGNQQYSQNQYQTQGGNEYGGQQQGAAPVSEGYNYQGGQYDSGQQGAGNYQGEY